MKILFLSDGIYPFSIGGMQKHSSEMVKVLLDKNCSVTLVFCVEKDQQLPNFEEIAEKLSIPLQHKDKFTVIGLKFPSPGKFPGHYIRNSKIYSRNIFDVIKDQLINFDFIYAQGFTAWYLMESDVNRPPIGVNFHGLNMFQPTIGIKNKLIARMFRKSVIKNLKLADFIFSFGGIFNSIYQKIGVADKLIFQPIGIYSSKIQTTPKEPGDKLHFVFIGRNDRVKGLEILNRSLTSIPLVKFHFTFVGDIPSGKQLQRKDCRYTGILNEKEIENILQNADVLLCPSFSEGMPYVILEAMAKGLFIIATKVGAVSEMVDDSNGFLIEPGNSDSMTKAISAVEMMEKSGLMKRKRNSITKSVKFEWNLIIDQLFIDVKSKIDKK